MWYYKNETTKLQIYHLFCINYREKDVYDKDVWIGLVHKDGARNPDPRIGWMWLDGSNYVFQKWKSGEPNENEKYVRLRNGDWLGTPINQYSHFLCQKGKIMYFLPDG